MKNVLATSLCAILFIGCQKENDANECATTMESISGTYKIESIQYKMNASATPVDYLATMDPCEKDDVLELKNNGTYIYTDAGIACSPNGSNNGTWTLAGAVITSDGIIQGTIQSYDCKKLICYLDNVVVTGDRITQVLVRQ